MNYINRLFFRKDTGALIYRYSMQGDIVISTVQQDIQVLKPLSDYKLDAIIAVDVAQNDVETQQNIEKAKSIKLNTQTNIMEFVIPDVTDEITLIQNQIAELTEQLNALQQQ